MCVSGAECGRGDRAAQVAAPPSLDDAGMTRCTLVPSQLRPFIVDWSATDRGALELQLARGVLAARYEGCALTLLPNCHVDGEYVYSGVTRKHESLTIRSVDGLYARLPLGAVELEPSLERTGQLLIDMTLIGMLEARRAGWSRADMEGQCTGATHVILGAHVGAFTFYSGTTTNVATPDASVTEHELLNTDGSGVAMLVTGAAQVRRIHSRLSFETASPSGDPRTPQPTVATTTCPSRQYLRPAISGAPTMPPGRRGADGEGHRRRGPGARAEPQLGDSLGDATRCATRPGPRS